MTGQKFAVHNPGFAKNNKSVFFRFWDSLKSSSLLRKIEAKTQEIPDCLFI